PRHGLIADVADYHEGTHEQHAHDATDQPPRIGSHFESPSCFIGKSLGQRIPSYRAVRAVRALRQRAATAMRSPTAISFTYPEVQVLRSCDSNSASVASINS